LTPRTTLTAAVLLLAALAACRRDPGGGKVVSRRVLMGTEVTVTAWDEIQTVPDIEKAVEAAFDRMDALEDVLSKHEADSELSALNRRAGQGPTRVGEEIWRVLLEAREAWRLSSGAFDPTVGPLVRLWIEAARNDRFPTEEAVRRARARTGFGHVILESRDGHGGNVTLPEGFSLDLGGIAKGWIVDRGVEVLKAWGLENVLVEAGGDLYASGARPDGTPWRVGVQDPEAGREGLAGLAAVLAVRDRGVTTSGHYRRFSTIEGKDVSHILDPRAGRPVEQTVLSVTVVAPTASRADGLSTAVAVLGPGEGLELAESLPGVEALLLVPGDEPGSCRVLQTDGLPTAPGRPRIR